MKSCDNIHELSRELGIERKLLDSWKYLNYLGTPPPEPVETRLRWEIKELKEALGERAAEVDFFVAALR